MATLAKLDWQTVNLDTLPKGVAPQYASYRKALEKAEAERKDFEAAVEAHMAKTKMIPSGKEVRFAYRWGKLAIAFADPGEARTKGAGEMFTF